MPKPERVMERRRGEMPDSVYILIETFVEDLFNELERDEKFDIKNFPRNQRFIDRTYRELMREEMHVRMKERRRRP